MDLKCPSSGEVGAQSLGEPAPPQEHGRDQVRHRHPGGLRVGQGTHRRTQARRDLSAAVLVGASARAGAAGQVAEAGAAGPDADFAPGTGRADHRRCLAGAVPSPVAQGDLGAGAARSLTADDHPPNPPPAARLRIAQRHVHRAGRLVAHRLGTGQGRARLGRGREEVSGSDRGLRRGGGGPCQSARGQGRATADGQAASRDGRRPSARAQGATGAGVEPNHVRAVAGEVRSPKSKVQSRRPARGGDHGQDDLLQLRLRGGGGGAQDGAAGHGQAGRDCL